MAIAGCWKTSPKAKQETQLALGIHINKVITKFYLNVLQVVIEEG